MEVGMPWLNGWDFSRGCYMPRLNLMDLPFILEVTEHAHLGTPSNAKWVHALMIEKRLDKSGLPCSCYLFKKNKKTHRSKLLLRNNNGVRSKSQAYAYLYRSILLHIRNKWYSCFHRTVHQNIIPTLRINMDPNPRTSDTLSHTKLA